MPKILVVIFLVSVFFAAAGYLYFAKPDFSEKVDISRVEWVDYENKELGFRVKYPKEFKPQEYNRGMAMVGGGEGVNFGLITFEKEANPKKISLNEYINKSILCGEARIVKEDCPTREGGEIVEVAGIKARKIVNPPAPIPSEMVIFEKDGSFYHFILDQADPTVKYSTEERSSIFEEFLNSFGFLDKN